MYKISHPISNNVLLVTALLIVTISPLTAHSQNNTRPAPSPGVKTDKRVYPEPPPPALPVAGGTFQDPVFGTIIMRVTDERDGAFNVTAYSYYPTFNKDSTRLLIITGKGEGALYEFDSANFRISGKRRLFTAAMPGGGFPGSEDAIWSGTDPDVIYCHAYLKLYAYNVSSNRYTLVHDFAGELPGAEITQLSKSIDDNAFGFHLKDAAYKVVGYAAWQKTQNNLYRVDTADVNEVQVDKTGQYLYVITETSGPANAIEGRVVNLQSRQVTDLTDGPPDYAPGHKDMGRGFVVGYENWKNSFLYRSLATPHKFHTVLSFGNDWSQSNHASQLADDDNWILISTFVANDLPSSKLFRNELFQVSTDGTQRVRRLAHMHSVYREYWDTPRASMSKDGRFAAFTSNWGSASRRDVFVVKIPPPNAVENAARIDAAPVASNVASNPAIVQPARNNDSVSRQNVAWASLIRCAATGSGLQKTGGRDDAPDAGASSEQSITSGKGFVEFTAVETNKTRYCGLARNSSGTDFAGIDFAIKLTATGAAEVRENGAYAGEVKYQSNDVFRIAIEDGQVKYYKNGSPFYTSLNEPAYPLVVKASFVNFNSRINNVVISTAALKPAR